MQHISNAAMSSCSEPDSWHCTAGEGALQEHPPAGCHCISPIDPAVSNKCLPNKCTHLLRAAPSASTTLQAVPSVCSSHSTCLRLASPQASPSAQLSLPNPFVVVCRRGGFISRHPTHLQAPLYVMQLTSAALTCVGHGRPARPATTHLEVLFCLLQLPAAVVEVLLDLL